jgi:hypothetical protein
LAAALLIGGAGAADAAQLHDELVRPWAFRHRACLDDKVADLAGRTVPDALARVRPMNLVAVRVLDRWTPVTLERVPERLTLVVHDNGVIVRAFCR